MTWLLLHLYRRSIIFWIALAGLMTGTLLVLYWDMAPALGASDVQICLKSLANESISGAAHCSPNAFATLDNFRHITSAILAGVSALPLAVGMFVAAPLIGRELENGTHRLIWSQSVTPMRWLVISVACCLGLSLTLVIVVAAAARPWVSLGQIVWQGSPWPAFDISALTLAAYAALASSIGLATATIFGRTVVAMAATAAVWGTARGLVEVLVRPHVIPPLIRPGMTADAAGDSWFLGITYLDSAGHILPAGQATALGGGNLLAHGISIAGVYQPASRFWTLQAIEASLFVVAAGVSLLAAAAWLRYRVASQ